jgi:hypothetical protein
VVVSSSSLKVISVGTGRSSQRVELMEGNNTCCQREWLEPNTVDIIMMDSGMIDAVVALVGVLFFSRKNDSARGG